MSIKYLWYTPDTATDTPEYVHQVFAYGTLDEAQEVVARLGYDNVKELFLKYPKKVYSRPTLNFLTKFLLHISGPINESYYLKTSPRASR